MEIGRDAVVIGNVFADARIGEGSVVIGPTDANGNTVLTQSMAIGRGAKAGHGSIAIGAYAVAGSTRHLALEADLDQLAEIVAAQQDPDLARAFEQFREEIRVGRGKKSGVLMTWRGMSSLSTIGGAHDLIDRISRALISMFG